MTEREKLILKNILCDKNPITPITGDEMVIEKLARAIDKAGKEVPAVTEADNGKTLIVNGGRIVAENNVFSITLTVSGSSVTGDHTPTEAIAAHTAGKAVMVTVAGSSASMVIPLTGIITSSDGASVHFVLNAGEFTVMIIGETVANSWTVSEVSNDNS